MRGRGLIGASPHLCKTAGGAYRFIEVSKRRIARLLPEVLAADELGGVGEASEDILTGDAKLIGQVGYLVTRGEVAEDPGNRDTGALDDGPSVANVCILDDPMSQLSHYSVKPPDSALVRD